MDQYDISTIRIKFNGSFSNRFPPTTSNYNDSNYPTSENCLFGSVKLTKNADIDKY